MRLAILSLLLLSTYVQLSAQQTEIHQIGADIQLIRLTDNTFIHRSFDRVKDAGRVSTNGMVYIVDSLCMVFDTPFTTATTVRLLDHLKEERGLTVVGLVVSRFHENRTVGLDSVHARGIPTFAYRKTVARFKADGRTAPQNGFFFRKKELQIGEQTILNYHPGPASTKDNIVSYLPSEGVLFGGSLVKTSGASLGNPTDAKPSKWPKSVSKVKEQFPDVRYVVPGRGRYGDAQLLDYTMELFNAEDN